MAVYVSNTSPLIAFSRIGRLDVPRAVCGRLTVPQAVVRELRAGAREGESIIGALSEGWIAARAVVATRLSMLLTADLGAGEAEALVLGVELNATVLLDDRAGRIAAERLKIDYVGTLGLLRQAKHEGVIKAAKPLVTALREIAGIYWSDALVQRFLREEGEA